MIYLEVLKKCFFSKRGYLFSRFWASLDYPSSQNTNLQAVSTMKRLIFQITKFGGFPGITNRFEWFAIDYNGDILHSQNQGLLLFVII